MKFSYGWMRELVPDLTTEPAELERLITTKTAECEGIENFRSDWIIEIDNKSLTHRPDLWGHYGMAREVAAITGNKLHDPVDLTLLPRGETVFKVEIADYSLCPRYSALVFENVKVEPSPLRMQERLESIGMKGINNIVDATNYVLAELPQPMHAFDADKLVGDVIFVRQARWGERLHALNGETYELVETDLVIADAAGPIALAGVIGGADSSISEATTRIVFESANFQATSVRLTSARHRLRTDASMRFEKALDPENTVRGLARAVGLLREVCPEARPAGGLTDNRAAPRAQEPILLPLSFVVRKLGKRLSEEEVSHILGALGFGVTTSAPGLLSVTVPSWRATKDISLKDDLVEEVGRMVGYNEIVPVAPLVASVVPPSNPMRAYLRKLRRIIADQGFSEVYNDSFTAANDAGRFHGDLNEHLVVRNPIASELTHMRRSLLPGLFKNIVSNVRNYSEFRLFEVGNEIHAAHGTVLPDEVTHLAAVLYAAHADERNFFELKRVAECLFPGIALMAAYQARPYEHPARTAVVHWYHAEIGRLFELHPSLLKEEGVEGRAVFFDVDLRQALEISSQQPVSYTSLRKYPTSGFDLSVVADAKTPVAELRQQLSKLAGENLVSIEFIRQYQGAPLSEGQKSVSYHLEAGALDHTLTNEEAASIRQRIVQGMLQAGYEIRGIN